MDKFRTILFDLDGTLIDHFNVIYRCFEHTMNALDRPVPSYEEVKRAVGGAMENTIRQFIDDETHAEAVRIYREHFSEIFLEDITILPGVEWLLPELTSRGKQLAVYTNKQGPGSRAICQHVGLDRHFTRIFGSLDTPYRKPDREFSEHVLSEMKAKPETTCMVGDSPWDIETARAIGMTCYAVSTGTHSAAELTSAGADAVFPDFFQLGETGFGLEPAPSLKH